LIEGISVIPNVTAMCEIDGTDVFFFGPADFSATAGYRGQWRSRRRGADPATEIRDPFGGQALWCHGMATSIDNLVERREQGFRMLGVGSDSGLLLRSIHQALQAVERDRMPAPRAVQLPTAQPPEE
jgi:2-keto-3-deoxy-L-rhamnonate aldolase RhmA